MSNLDPSRVFTAFPWYTDKKLLNHYKEQCLQECHFKLLTPLNSLLPFNIVRPRIPNEIISWQVMCPDGSNVVDLDPELISIYTAADGDHIIYNGADLGLELPCGFLVSVITDGVNTFYSEMFWVESDLAGDDPCVHVTETGEHIITETSELHLVC